MSRYDPQRHRRRSIRLPEYDYTQPGAYFVTICTHNREPLFGQVVDGEMVLNKYGQIVWEEWFRSANIRAGIELFTNEFVVMPNHIHGIVWIVDAVGATGRSPLQPTHPRGPASRSLGSFIAGFKSIVTKRINAHRATPGARVWQRNYHEHIIRTERVLNVIRQYIVENPLCWDLDRCNPDATGPDPQDCDLWRMLRNDAHTHRRGTTALRPYNQNDDHREGQP